MPRLGRRQTLHKDKIRKDIHVNRAVTNSVDAVVKAIRYYDAVANQEGLSNTDMFVKVMQVYYAHTGTKIEKKISTKQTKLIIPFKSKK